jgi:hypothetical protein
MHENNGMGAAIAASVRNQIDTTVSNATTRRVLLACLPALAGTLDEMPDERPPSGFLVVAVTMQKGGGMWMGEWPNVEPGVTEAGVVASMGQGRLLHELIGAIKHDGPAKVGQYLFLLLGPERRAAHTTAVLEIAQAGLLPMLIVLADHQGEDHAFFTTTLGVARDRDSLQ